MQKDEKPIVLRIFHFGSDKMLVSHASMSYDGQNIDYSSKGFSDNATRSDCFEYNIYPSEVGIDPESLKKAITEQKKNVKGDDYNYLTQNCADQVIAVLETAGAKDIPQPLGIAVPSIPVLDDLEDWAKVNGHLVKGDKAYHAQRQQDLNTYRDYISAATNPEEFKKNIKKEYEQDKKSSKNLYEKAKATKKYFERYLMAQNASAHPSIYLMRAASLYKDYETDSFFTAHAKNKLTTTRYKIAEADFGKIERIFDKYGIDISKPQPTKEENHNNKTPKVAYNQPTKGDERG